MKCSSFFIFFFLAWFLFKIPESGFSWFSETWSVLLGSRLLAGLWLGCLWVRLLASSHSCISASSITWWRENPVYPEPHWRGLCLQFIWGGFSEECNRKVSGLPGQAHAIGQLNSKVGKWTPGHFLGRFRPEQTETQGMCEESVRASFCRGWDFTIPECPKPPATPGPEPQGFVSLVCHISFFPFLEKCVDEQKPDMNLARSQFMREMSFSGCVLPRWHLWARPAVFITVPGPGSRMTWWQVWGRGLLPICVHVKPIIFEQALMELGAWKQLSAEGNVTKIPCILKHFQTIGLMIKDQQKTCWPLESQGLILSKCGHSTK